MDENDQAPESDLELEARNLLRWIREDKQGKPPEGEFSLYDQIAYLENNKYIACLRQTPKAAASFGYRPTLIGLEWSSEN